MTNPNDTSFRHDKTSALPAASVVAKKRFPVSMVWLIPLIVGIIGGWLAINTLMNQGPTITISFHSAEGLEAGKTKIKFKDVEVGTVKKIDLAPNISQGVIVTAEMDKQVEEHLVDDTAFWVVKPRLSGGGLSGFTTLVSGSYIGMEIGESTSSRKDFTGLEVPPILTKGQPGKMFRLKADDLGSIDYGTPVYYRRITAGEVVAYSLDEDGRHVTLDVFVKAPYDQYVTSNTRFWSVSGLGVSMGADGFKLAAESLTSIMLGGIAFAEPPYIGGAEAVEEGRLFRLYDNNTEAFKRQDNSAIIYRMIFRESVHGLSVGAPVEFRGIPIGEVIHIGIHFDEKAREITIPVLVRLYPERLVEKADSVRVISEEEQNKTLASLISNGMRGQLKVGSLLTGQLYIAFDFFRNAGKATLNTEATPHEIPVMLSGLQNLENSVTSIVAKLDKIPIEQIGNDLRDSIQSLSSSLKEANALMNKLGEDIAPQISRVLKSAENTLEQGGKLLSQDAPMQQELRDALGEVSRAARSVRMLTDYLERHPEALIRGKTPEKGDKK